MNKAASARRGGADHVVRIARIRRRSPRPGGTDPVLDNIGPDREQETGVPPPFLTLRSPWDDEHIAALHDYLGRTGSVAYDVELANSNHFTCTDLPLFLSDLRVDGIEPADGIDECADILTSFFDAYLRRRRSTDAPWQPPIDAAKITIRRF